jgi:hypothetical protein
MFMLCLLSSGLLSFPRGLLFLLEFAARDEKDQERGWQNAQARQQ